MELDMKAKASGKGHNLPLSDHFEKALKLLKERKKCSRATNTARREFFAEAYRIGLKAGERIDEFDALCKAKGIMYRKGGDTFLPVFKLFYGDDDTARKRASDHA
jgi:hypothetical protein